jgi:hypothetical protein
MEMDRYQSQKIAQNLLREAELRSLKLRSPLPRFRP